MSPLPTFSVAQRCVPLLHMYGKIAGGPFVSALLETMLLCVHIAMVERATAPVSALSGHTSRFRIGELPVVRGGGTAGGISAANLLEHQIGQFADEQRKGSVLHAPREAECLLLDMQMLHLPSVRALGRHTFRPHFQAVGYV